MDDYDPQPRWTWVPAFRGWGSTPITAEEDFHEPYVDGWDLI